MTKQDATEYLKKVLENLSNWESHHKELRDAIEVLLEEVKGEDRNN